MFDFPLPVAGLLVGSAASGRIACGQNVPAGGGSFHSLHLLTINSAFGASRYIAGKASSPSVGTWRVAMGSTGNPSLFWNMATTNLQYASSDTPCVLDQPMLLGLSVDISAGAGAKVQIFTRKFGQGLFKASTINVLNEGAGGSITDDQDLTIGNWTGGNTSPGAQAATHHFYAYWDGPASIDKFNNMLVGDNLIGYLQGGAYWRPGMYGPAAVPDEGGHYHSHGKVASTMTPQPILIEESWEDRTDDDEWALSVAGKSAALTGTAAGGIVEANVVSGGKQIILTLTGDTWIPT